MKVGPSKLYLKYFTTTTTTTRSSTASTSNTITTTTVSPLLLPLLPIPGSASVLFEERGQSLLQDIEDICFFSEKDRNLFHRVDTIGNIFTSGAATSENITDGVHEMK